MENKNIFVLMAFVAALVLVVGGFFWYRDRLEKPANNQPVPIGDQAAVGEHKYYTNIEIDSRDFFFSPDVFEVKAGEKVTVSVKSIGDNTFVIDELGVNKKTPDGQVTTIEFTPTQKGVYRYYCSLPGHREAGQVGTLIAQ